MGAAHLVRRASNFLDRRLILVTKEALHPLTLKALDVLMKSYYGSFHFPMNWSRNAFGLD